jgi:hypothetical protein
VRRPLSLTLFPPASSALSSVVTPAALTVYVVSLDRQRAADVVVKVVKATAGWHMRDSAKSTSVLLSAVVDRLWPGAEMRGGAHYQHPVDSTNLGKSSGHTISVVRSSSARVHHLWSAMTSTSRGVQPSLRIT